MEAFELAEILRSLPDSVDTHVYFEIPSSSWEPGEQLGVNIIEYNNVTNELVLKWDCPANHTECSYDCEER